MCGIAGKVDTRKPVRADLLERMCATIEHRGPDSRGIHLHDGVGLGVQRLAIIDLEHGDQPIYNEDRSVVLVLNGEIYNYIELGEELRARGHRLATGSDTETIAHLYEELGDACVDRLRGMFAFALWDVRRRRLLLARDRVGKKPLYYRVTPTAIWFASEPRAILQDSEVPRSADLGAIDSYLRYQYVPQPRSAFAELRKLPAAHVLSWVGGVAEIKRYWRLDYRHQRAMTMDDAGESVRETLLEATAIRMRSDVPVGAFLSGGLDSSAVVAAMARSQSAQIKTFSIGFDVEGFDETHHAREVAAVYSTDHHEFQVRADAVELLPRLVWHYGEPFADSSALPSFYLSELTRRHVKVALTGDGGDESFAGYDRYQAMMLTDRLRRLPAASRRALALLAEKVGPGGGPRTPRARAVRGMRVVSADPWQRYDRWMSYFTRSELDHLYDPAMLGLVREAPEADALISEPWSTSTGKHLVDVMLDVDIQTYLPGDLLTKMDIATMANSLEVRSPLLDHVLMERAAEMPAALKLRRGSSKAVLKHAMRPWLPTAVIDRPKMGFGVPLADWFRGELRDLPDRVLLDPAASARGIFRPAKVRQLIDDHRTGRADNASRLWALISLELWFRTYIDTSDFAVAPVAQVW